MPHDERPRELLAECPGRRSVDAQEHGRHGREGQPGGDAEVAALEELDADRQEGDAEDPHERQRRPVVGPDEGHVVERPGERAQGQERTAHVQAGHDPRGGHRQSGDPGRAGTAEERREGEGEPAEEECEEADPEGEADRGQQRDRVAQGGLPEDVRAERQHDGRGPPSPAPAASGARRPSRARCGACRTEPLPRSRGCRGAPRRRGSRRGRRSDQRAVPRAKIAPYLKVM